MLSTYSAVSLLADAEDALMESTAVVSAGRAHNLSEKTDIKQMEEMIRLLEHYVHRSRIPSTARVSCGWSLESRERA